MPAPNHESTFSLLRSDGIDKDARLRWLGVVILIALVGYFLSFLTGLPGGSISSQEWTEGITVLLLGVALWAALRGSLVLAATITVASVWLEIHHGLYYTGSFHGSGLTVLPALIAGTGILLGGRVAIGMAVLSSLSVPAVVLSGRVIHNADHLFGMGDLKGVLNLAAVFVVMAVIISFGLRYLGEALSASRRSERRFFDLVAGNPDGILALDGQGRIEALNPAAEALLGLSSHHARGARLEDLSLGPGFRFSASHSGADSEKDPIPMEQTVTRPDGSRSRVEVVRRPLTGPDGDAGSMLVLRDLTERREMEARATQFGRMVEEAHSEIYVFHRDTLAVLMANRGARENLGFNQDEIRGMAMSHIQPTLTSGARKTLARRLFAEGEEVVTMNTVHHRKDGTVYPLEVRFQRGSLEGEPAILAFGIDISQKEAAEEEQRLLQTQLQHAQKMEAVGLLAGGVAHDFNNLLTVIGGCGEILMDVGDQEVRSLTEEILNAQEKGASLTQQLLAFARRDIVQVGDLSLSEVIRSSEILIRRVLGEKVQLRLLLEDEANVRADRGQVEQVILNLVANGRDAMEKGGTLTIRVGRGGMAGSDGGEEEFAALMVEDTGQGMDARTMERVFEPFFTTKPRGKGTGLGLSTVQGIVTQNGGRITVDSQPGKGTRIRILWPLAQPEEEIRHTPERPADTPSDDTILVAEDEEGARTLIQTILEREGYRVVVVENGAEALVLMRDPTRRFSLLLTDIVMPGVNGLELAEEVRELRPGLPILFMSGFVDSNLQGPEGKSGPLNLLAKPFRPAELRRAVGEILKNRLEAPVP